MSRNNEQVKQQDALENKSALHNISQVQNSQASIAETHQVSILKASDSSHGFSGEALLLHPGSAMVIPAVFWVLIMFSVVSWATFIFKGYQFSKFKKLNRKFFNLLPGSGKISEIDYNGKNGAFAQIAMTGVQAVEKSNANKNIPHAILCDNLERSLQKDIHKERHRLEKGLAILASIGSTAPFIGLFGTVWGIMEALVHIGIAGQADLGNVAGPIGHALIATGIGIAVAVPALLFYNYFVRLLKKSLNDMEFFSVDIYISANQAMHKKISCITE